MLNTFVACIWSQWISVWLCGLHACNSGPNKAGKIMWKYVVKGELPPPPDSTTHMCCDIHHPISNTSGDIPCLRHIICNHQCVLYTIHSQYTLPDSLKVVSILNIGIAIGWGEQFFAMSLFHFSLSPLNRQQKTTSLNYLGLRPFPQDLLFHVRTREVYYIRKCFLPQMQFLICSSLASILHPEVTIC